MPKPDHKNEIYIGMALIGTTGILIGLVMDSPLLMVIAGFLGLVVGGFVGWLGGYRYMVITVSYTHLTLPTILLV